MRTQGIALGRFYQMNLAKGEVNDAIAFASRDKSNSFKRGNIRYAFAACQIYCTDREEGAV